LSGIAINGQRSDGYQSVTSWGPAPHQQGDDRYLVGTGPAATDVFPRSTDGLGNRIIGTAFNCSGATTPWGTVMSAEENFQGGTTGNNPFYMGVQEDVQPDGRQLGYLLTTNAVVASGTEFGLVGEKYGWLVEVDPDDPGFRPRKHTALGRFRHENSVPVANGFASGTLFNGRLRLPRRAGVAGQSIDGGSAIVERNSASGIIPEATAFQAHPAGYLEATLADFYASQGAILCDAFHAGNLVGGTPAARPEDLEVNPRNHREVFISFTDGAPGGDGYPDSRIFEVAKLTSAVSAIQQSGGLYKITEDSRDGTGDTFRWERLEQGGEAGASIGSGFAAVDNLAFDRSGNVWRVTDMSTGLHNGFTDGLPNNPTTIDHTATADVSSFIGVFGNNWLFYVPTSGRDAGKVIPFAYGPTRSEMTGPTFVSNTLFISVQHPGEDCDFQLAPEILTRDIEMLNLDGTVFTQKRSVTRSSTWPSNIEGLAGGPPRPCVIAIQRKDSRLRFV
jgi:secreted PhoX family phosphatase